jgi:hypothetical protein
MSNAQELADEFAHSKYASSTARDVALLDEIERMRGLNSALWDLAKDFLKAQDELDNREYAGINGESYSVLLRRKKEARNDLEDVLITGDAALSSSGGTES